MFSKLSYKQKLKLLPVVFAAALLLVYLLAVQKTLEIKKECKVLKEQIQSAGNAPVDMAEIRGRLDQLNGIMGKDTTGPGTDPLLEFVTNTDAGSLVSLVDFQPLHHSQQQNYTIETRVAVFEGSFVHQLKCLYNLERSFRSGKIVSVKFTTETNLKTEKQRLLMTILIQSLVTGGNVPLTDNNKKI